MTRPGRTRAGLIAAALVTTGAVVALVGGAAAPTNAQTTASLQVRPADCCFSADGRNIDIVVAAPPPSVIDKNSIRLTTQLVGANLQVIKPAITSPDSSTATVKRSAMLALDNSGSMTPEKLDAAKKAALLFLQRVDPDVRVGLVTFGDPAKLLIDPTMDREEVRSAIQKLSADGGDTAMYEAVVKSAKAMGSAGTRSIIMLTDGNNEDLTAPFSDKGDARQVLTKDKNSPIDFAGVIVESDKRANIDAIAGRGAVIAVQNTATLTTKLNQFFGAGAEKISNQLQLTAPVPPALAGQSVVVQLTASTTTGQQLTFVNSSTIKFPAAPVATTTNGASPPRVLAQDRRLTAVTTPIVLFALLGLFIALAAIVFVATGALTRSAEQESPVVRRLAVYTVASARPQQIAVTEQTTRLGDSALARSAVGLMSRVARTGQIERALDSRLEAAGLPLRTAEWMLIHISAAVVTSLLLLVLSRGSVIGLVLGLLLGLIVPLLVLSALRSRRERTFLRQLPDTLTLLAGSLAAGYSLPQAMDSVVREAKPPISVEFNRSLIEARLGMPPEDALEGIAGRTNSQDFSWIVMAIRIQRDVGGNLAELLSTVADTLRERERLRRQVNSLSAEGKLSGVILVALPLVFILYLALVRPTYLAPLVSTPMGWLLLGLGGALLLVGGFWMSRLIKVDV